MSDISFVTFADNKYANTLKRIEKEAGDMGIFKNIFAWNQKILDNSFLIKHQNFIIRKRRGYGYWIWKPYVIKKALQSIPENSILVYSDAGCTLNPLAKDLLIEFGKLAKKSESGVLAAQMGYIESHYTKMDLMVHLGFTEYESKQIQAGISVWCHAENALSFLDEWQNLCSEDNYHFLDDSPSVTLNVKEFIEHCHDQSIFSLLMKKHKGFLVNKWPNNESYPIWTSRLKF